MGPILNLTAVEAASLMTFLYKIFHRDFVAQKTHLSQSIWVDPQSHRLEDGKEVSFWHLTSRTQNVSTKVGNRYVTVSERFPDFRRSERLEWVKWIIENHADPRVKLFYHRENNPKRDVRLYLWVHEHDFVVILQKLGRSRSFLVTSFYVDHQRKKRDYEQRYNAYVAGTQPDLHQCEWF